MADVTDQNLIRAYVRGRCEQSFGELVHRHVDLVHSTALRVVRDASLAEDVTQRVFLTLARHSVNLQERFSLTGWLHETARNLAINTVRGEERRRRREQEAAAMSNLESNESDAVWKQIAPHLDEAIAELNSVEREVILWRYFERRTAEQIGGRLGLTPEAAQKRVARALDRLRGILTEGGLTVPTASLTALLSTQAVQSAPVGLAASAITAVSATSAILPATSTLPIIMASTKAISDGRNKADDRGAFELENARTLLAKAPEIPMIQRNEFRNAGYATSLASFDTMNWAAANRDTNAMFNAIGLESKARKRADELFAQMPEPIRQKYGSVDALLVDWRMNLAEAPEAYRVLSQREDGPDAAILTVQFQYPNSRVRENDLSFYRDQSGVWRQAMPP